MAQRSTRSCAWARGAGSSASSRRRGVHRDARAGVRGALRRRAAREDGGVPRALRERRGAREAPLRGVRRRARGAQARVRPAHLRRPDDGRDRPPRGRDRRDEDRRGQDVRREPRALPERDPDGRDARRAHDRPRRPPRHRQRLPRQARRRVEPARLRAARHDRRLDRVDDAVRGPQGRVRVGHHLRDELRVRLRLPARQHGDLARPDSSSADTPTRSWTRSTRS